MGAASNRGWLYSRAAFINFGLILDNVNHKSLSTEDWFTKSVLRVIHIQLSPRTSECVPLAIMTTPIKSSSRTHACGYYSSAAIISFTELQVRLLFEGGYYLGCGFYSNKYSNRHSGRCTLLAPPASGHTAHTYVYHYLDDFIIVGPPQSPQCTHLLAILDRECNILSIPMASHKWESSTTCLPVLGSRYSSWGAPPISRQTGAATRATPAMGRHPPVHTRSWNP